MFGVSEGQEAQLGDRKSNKAKGRSARTNGTVIFGKLVDGRSTWARRMRDLLDLHTADLGGVDVASAAERSIIRRASTITVELELLEQRFAIAGGASIADLDLYLRASNTLRRLFEVVGLQRRQRDVTPSLRSYLAERVDKEDQADVDIEEAEPLLSDGEAAA